VPVVLSCDAIAHCDTLLVRPCIHLYIPHKLEDTNSKIDENARERLRSHSTCDESCEKPCYNKKPYSVSISCPYKSLIVCSKHSFYSQVTVRGRSLRARAREARDCIIGKASCVLDLVDSSSDVFRRRDARFWAPIHLRCLSRMRSRWKTEAPRAIYVKYLCCKSARDRNTIAGRVCAINLQCDQKSCHVQCSLSEAESRDSKQLVFTMLEDDRTQAGHSIAAVGMADRPEPKLQSPSEHGKD
jgi:hypothetical protein